jgi:hypothetical protein
MCSGEEGLMGEEGTLYIGEGALYIGEGALYSSKYLAEAVEVKLIEAIAR